MPAQPHCSSLPIDYPRCRTRTRATCTTLLVLVQVEVHICKDNTLIMSSPLLLFLTASERSEEEIDEDGVETGVQTRGQRVEMEFQFQNPNLKRCLP